LNGFIGLCWYLTFLASSTKVGQVDFGFFRQHLTAFLPFSVSKVAAFSPICFEFVLGGTDVTNVGIIRAYAKA
jgi:hypothetical protein